MLEETRTINLNEELNDDPYKNIEHNNYLNNYLNYYLKHFYNKIKLFCNKIKIPLCIQDFLIIFIPCAIIFGLILTSINYCCF